MKYEFWGIKWYKYHGVLLPDVAPHENIALSEKQAKKMIKLTQAYMVRWASDFDSSIEYPFWYVLKDEREDVSLKSYKAKIRSEIKRGLRNCRTELLSHSKRYTEDFMLKLYEIYVNAFKRYKKNYANVVDSDTYQKNISKDLMNPNKDFWLVTLKESGEPIAYAQTVIKGNVVSYNVIKLHPDYLKFYPSYSLIFEMNRYYLNERNFLYVHDGTRSIGHETHIHEWLIKKFKFRKAYCKLNVVYRDDVRSLVNILFPFREIIYRCGNILCNKLSPLLKQEEIRRKCEMLSKRYG